MGGSNIRILVVEDESIVAMDIAKSLDKLGYEAVAVVASGEQAIIKAGETRPDLILMDIVLKGDMDGVEAAKQIREKLNIPVIYLTAYADDTVLSRAKLTEPLGYIIKPFSERELRSAIEIALYKNEMETKLKKMERWLSVTLRSIGDGVIATDNEMRVTFINKVAEDMTGWKQEDVIGKKLAEIFSICGVAINDKEEVERFLTEKVLKEGVIMNFMEDNILFTKDRRKIVVSDSIAPIREEDHIPGIVIVFRDMSGSSKKS